MSVDCELKGIVFNESMRILFVGRESLSGMLMAIAELFDDTPIGLCVTRSTRFITRYIARSVSRCYVYNECMEQAQHTVVKGRLILHRRPARTILQMYYPRTRIIF